MAGRPKRCGPGLAPVLLPAPETFAGGDADGIAMRAPAMRPKTSASSPRNEVTPNIMWPHCRPTSLSAQLSG